MLTYLTAEQSATIKSIHAAHFLNSAHARKAFAKPSGVRRQLTERERNHIYCGAVNYQRAGLPNESPTAFEKCLADIPLLLRGQAGRLYFRYRRAG